jgi:hypothetical protein
VRHRRWWLAGFAAATLALITSATALGYARRKRRRSFRVTVVAARGARSRWSSDAEQHGRNDADTVRATMGVKTGGEFASGRCSSSTPSRSRQKIPNATGSLDGRDRGLALLRGDAATGEPIVGLETHQDAISFLVPRDGVSMRAAAAIDTPDGRERAHRPPPERSVAPGTARGRFPVRSPPPVQHAHSYAAQGGRTAELDRPRAHRGHAKAPAGEPAGAG